MHRHSHFLLFLPMMYKSDNFQFWLIMCSSGNVRHCLRLKYSVCCTCLLSHPTEGRWVTGEVGKKGLKTSKTVVQYSVALSSSHETGCWLFPVQCWSSPLQWMCEIAAYWQKQDHAKIHVDPVHTKQAQWVTCYYAGNTSPGMFSASRNNVYIMATRVCVLSCWNMRRWQCKCGTKMGLWISLWLSCVFKLPSIKCFIVCYTCQYHTPTVTTLFTMMASANCSPTQRHTCCLPSLQYNFILHWNEGHEQKFVQKFFVFANHFLHQKTCWMVSDHLAYETPGWCNHTWSAVVRYFQILKDIVDEA